MSLKFIFGSAGTGKTHRALTEILKQAQQAPAEDFLVIVPEQFSMQTQDILTARHPGGTILNVDVLSFNRLAYRVFEEVGFKTGKLLEDTGKSFLLQKIALEKEADLEAFGGRLKKPGNIEEMKSVLSELMQYDISPDKLEESSDGRKDYLAAKLGDIALVYREFKSYLEKDFMVAEEVPDILCTLVEKSDYLRHAVMVFDGFTGFTPIQMKLLGRLLAMTKQIIVTVPMDETVADPFGSLPEESLFSMSSEMVLSLCRLARESGTTIEESIRLKGSRKSRFALSPSLEFLEKNIFRRSSAIWHGGKPDIEICEYPDPDSEAEACGIAIAGMIRREGLRYRDIAIMTGDLASYGIALKRALSEEGIPCFIDEKRSLLRNPFVEYIRSALAACIDGYSYDSIFRLLKSGMSGLEADDINRMENYVLATGVKGKKRWREPWVRMSREIGSHVSAEWEMEQLNLSRQKVAAILDPLSEALSSRSLNVREKTEAVYRFCVEGKCQEKLQQKAEAFRQEGREDLVSEYAQIYGKVMEVLDKLAAVLGNEHLTMSEIGSMIETGLSEIRIGIIPPGVDQVMVGDMERSRLKDIRVLFFVGVNEGLIPRSPSEGGFLSERDREQLAENGITLRPSPRRQLYIQNFYLYLALTKPSRRLILTYATASEKGEERRRAYLISQIQRLFPSLEIDRPGTVLLERTERPEDGFSLLAEGIRKIRLERPSEEWFELYGWYRSRPSYAQRMEKLLQAAAPGGGSDSISRASAKAVYGSFLRNSATRLEQFARCPFSHFAQYGLKLRKRELLEMNRLEHGNVLHEALQYFGSELLKSGRAWQSLTDEEREALAEKAIRQTADFHDIFAESERNAYELTRLERNMKTAAWVIERQLRAGDFELYGVEKAFDDSLKSRFFKLEDGTKMLLSGRIDRIDLCRDGDKRYLKIIDYKSGNPKLDLTEIYYGLRLQLVLYMNAVMEMEKRSGCHSEVAGILYHRVKDPVIPFKDARTEEQAEKKRQDSLREIGLVSSDENILGHFDRENKDGRKILEGGKTDALGFRVLGRYAERKAREIGNAMMRGEIGAEPFLYQSRYACQYCDYRDVCGFDDRLPDCHYRRLKKLSDEEVFEKMEIDEDRALGVERKQMKRQKAEGKNSREPAADEETRRTLKDMQEENGQENHE